MTSTAAWVDTGFLIALFARNDTHHDSAVRFLQDNQQLELHSIWSVITESCFFLGGNGKQALMRWLQQGALVMHEITMHDLPRIRETLAKYENIEPDFTDAVLVTKAELTKIRRVITVDVRDFSVYRFADGGTFDRLWV